MNSGDTAFMLIATAMVMLMTPGLALFYGGLVRSKNILTTMMHSFACLGIVSIIWVVYGYSLAFGPDVGGIIGNLDWALLNGVGLEPGRYAATIPHLLFCAFQLMFAIITPALITGAWAERMKFSAYLIFTTLWITLVYFPVCHWVWGGGWLSQLGKNFALGHGHVDFAGSSVVHMTGGVAALAGALVLGPRRGKFKADGTPNAIPGHHIPMAMVGCFILAFGWFGFNAGSTLAGGDLRIGVVAVNTMLASAAAAFTSMLYMWNRYGKPDISMIANGFLAGLVAITAPCAFVNSVAAVAIGAIAGIFLCLGVFFVERVMKIDDPVGAISVHGVNGAWGVLSVGLFADGTYGDGLNGVAGTVKGLFYGDASQFTAQLIGTATNIIFVFVIMYVFFKVLDKFVPLRVSEEMELAGLDHSEVAVNAYPEFNLNKTHR